LALAIGCVHARDDIRDTGPMAMAKCTVAVFERPVVMTRSFL